MKHLLLTVCFFNIAISFSSAQTPVAYYPFTGNANDAAGSNNGTVIGATLSTDRFGNANGAYNFNGTGQRIQLGNNSSLFPTTAITVSAWINLANANSGVSGETIISCTENQGYGLFYVKATDEMIFYVYRNGIFAATAINATPYKTGWHHIAGTYDGRYLRLYMNGQLADTDDAGATYPIVYDNLTDLCIGADLNTGNILNPDYHWNGKIDEVKIYNTALSAVQIQTEFLNANQAQQPGSGNAISFDGNNHIQIPDANNINDFASNQDFTLECWVKIPSTGQPNAGVGGNYIIDKTASADANASYNLVMNNQVYPQYDGMVFIQRNDGTNQPGIRGTTRINDNKWHHIAATRTGGNTGLLSIYIDGVLEGTVVDNTTGNTTNNDPVYIGSRYGNFSRLLGTIDEVRIWNAGLTQTQIRERMCRKITVADPLYSNLTAYYNFDETTGATAIDAALNANNATLISNPARVTSGAPIGNSSNYNYSATPSVTLSHPEGESLTATTTAGTPVGIHVYNVAEKPNTVSGAVGTGDNNRYFGVFVAGGTAPQYTATYDYTGNPNVNATNESGLLLYKRNDNAAASWQDCGATLNTVANTLTATGQNTEYLLGGGFIALPITLLHFEAVKQGTASLLQWSTSFERNNNGFEVLHSINGVQFTNIGFVNGAGNSSGTTNYSFVHTQPVKGANYYRLLQKDVDGRQSSSAIKQLNFTDDIGISIYPNPATTTLTIQLPFNADRIKLLDASGTILWQQNNTNAGTHTIALQQYPAGILLLQVADKQGLLTNYKIVKL